MKLFGFLCSLLVLLSCSKENSKNKADAIARVNNEYLYQSDLENLVPAGTPKKDSIAIVKSFIDNWATKKLLFEASERNISKAKTTEFNELIEQYKVDLYTKNYIEDLVVRQIDTLVTDEQIKMYYDKNKQFFNNSSELVKMRYINLVKENPKFVNIKSKFSSFTKKDRKDLEQQAVNFKSYAFNDSIWVDINQVFEKLPFVNLENKDRFISNGINFQYPDATTIWLVKVNKVLPKDSPTPLEFLKPTIKQIIVNNRKLELVNTIEKEITNDAINDNKYEIYK